MLESAQTSEGWFPEYGRAVPGYTSVSIDFLAKYWRRTRDKRSLSMIERSLTFLAHFVHPDGTVGGTVRFSQHALPVCPIGAYLRENPYGKTKRWTCRCRPQQAEFGLTLYALDGPL